MAVPTLPAWTLSPIKTTSMTNCETSACINKVVLWRPLEQFVRFSRGICREHPRSLLKHRQSFWSVSKGYWSQSSRVYDSQRHFKICDCINQLQAAPSLTQWNQNYTNSCDKQTWFLWLEKEVEQKAKRGISDVIFDFVSFKKTSVFPRTEMTNVFKILFKQRWRDAWASASFRK